MKAKRFKARYTNTDFLKDELKANESVLDKLMEQLATAYCNLNKLQNNAYNEERANLSYWQRYANGRKNWRKEHDFRRMDDS